MQLKRAAILEAATILFRQRGFAAVTTQEISERADIAAGTLFRYAATKNELLLLVYNEKLREALGRGAELAGRQDDLTEALVSLVRPMLELASAEGPENGRAYQRELLFGPPGERYREEGLELIADLESALSERLIGHASRQGRRLASNSARLAGSSIFAVTHLIISRSSTGAHAQHDPMDDLRQQIGQIVDGVFASDQAGKSHP